MYLTTCSLYQITWHIQPIEFTIYKFVLWYSKDHVARNIVYKYLHLCSNFNGTITGTSRKNTKKSDKQTHRNVLARNLLPVHDKY